MSFDKSVMYLGSQAMRLSDGSTYYQVQFYDRDSGTVSCNVGGNKTDVINALAALEFGQPVVVTFALRPKDRLYRLVIDHVA